MFKILAALCVLVALFLVFYDGSSVSNKVGSPTKKSINDIDKDINFRLKQADEKRRLKELRVENNRDDEELTGFIEEDLKSYKVKVPKGLDDRIDNTLDDVYNDLNLGDKKSVKFKLEDEVQRSLSELAEAEELDEYERAAFIKSFVENARKRGINIEIDKDLNVYTK